LKRLAIGRYQIGMPILKRFLPIIALLGLSLPALAQDAAEIPYWASIRVSEINMRAGPGEDYGIQWVYKRPMLPLKVLRIKEGWRFVRDPDGTQGWVLARFLTRQRTGYVQGKEPAEMRDKAGAEAKLLWRLAPGVVGLLGDCDKGWCGLTVGKRKGFVRQDRLWGAGEP
jgi:SH3-like domain-containing protein